MSKNSIPFEKNVVKKNILQDFHIDTLLYLRFPIILITFLRKC